MKSLSLILLLIGILGCSPITRDSEPFDRTISMEGQPNFRDLGAYQTTKGKLVKKGMIYRSGTLSQLTDADMDLMDSLNIKTVVNFLTEEERLARGEDRLPEGVKKVFLPISGENNEAKAVLEARKTGDFSAVPVDFNYKIHYLLIEDAKEAYAGLFQVLSDPDNYPMVFHCSHGVHRTGTAAALLLSILDVPWETVKEDYLLSNDCRKDENNMRIEALDALAISNGIANPEQNRANIEAFYVLQGEYIDGSKTAIVNNYGSTQDYLKSLGISDENIRSIQQVLLED